MTASRPEVHLRVLTPADAGWLIGLDEAAAGTMAHPVGFDAGLADALAAGGYASDARWGWAVIVDGEPGGFAVVTALGEGDASMDIRVSETLRGKGVGREVLRQLADHHFKDDMTLHRLVGTAHEANIAMQRAFNAAGFRMEARYRDAYEQPDGLLADRWGYALTRSDWEAGETRRVGDRFDLHGLHFRVEAVLDGPTTGSANLTFAFQQEGRRVTATFFSREVSDGELGGVMLSDIIEYRYLQGYDPVGEGHRTVQGEGRARVQVAADGRLQIINEWRDEDGRHGTTLLREKR